MSMIGKSLVHYEITSELGKGGMGEVYQAKDTKLGRDVAIKILPEEFARDADRVARFQREAKLLASLNHPNIAAIHGLEEVDGTNFLVMELIEGDTLADRIKTGPIPVEEALKLTLQIAEALEAAHEKGVIHRDLKPANIKVTPEGKIKILDFGLAKAFAEDQGEDKPLDSPTISAAATQKGVILGTAAYMSPEQAKGKSVDKRVDIWAFGVVLFEMLTGQQLFSGETASETLAAVMMRDPEFSKLPPNLHSRIRFLLDRCLKKEPRNRYSGISDARVEIQSVLADPSGVFAQPSLITKPKKKRRVGVPWVAAITTLGVIISGVAGWMLKPPPSREFRPAVRFDYSLPEGQQLQTIFTSLAVSPDGKRIVYSTTEGFYLRSMDEMTTKLISGTEGMCFSPSFSPDGKWIGYWSYTDRKLKKIGIGGGKPIVLCDANGVYGIDWYADDAIVYGAYDVTGFQAGIMRVSSNGGTPESLVKSQESRSFSISPQMLPDGKSILYTDTSSTSQGKVVVKSLISGERKELVAVAGFMARYLPTGHIVYSLPNDNSIRAVPFNLEKLQVTGDPIPIIDGVYGRATQYAFCDAGTLVYLPGIDASLAQRMLVWVGRDGKEEPLTAPPKAYCHPRISPDGKRIALTVGGEKSANIWIFDLDRGTLTRLTFDETADISPLWTPDGKRIVFFSIGKGKRGIYWKAADGTGKEELIASLKDVIDFPASWSGKGDGLVFEAIPVGKDASLQEVDLFVKQQLIGAIASHGAPDPGNRCYIGMLSMEGSRKSEPLFKEQFVVANPQLSPDGRWIAYFSTESYDIYVRPFPRVDDGKWQVSTGGGSEPRWSPEGRELFYRNGDAMMAVAVQTEPAFKAGTPQKLFQRPYYSMLGHMWDMSPDGKRFLMIKQVASKGETATSQVPRKINVVVNWFEELRQRVPVD